MIRQPHRVGGCALLSTDRELGKCGGTDCVDLARAWHWSEKKEDAIESLRVSRRRRRRASAWTGSRPAPNHSIDLYFVLCNYGTFQVPDLDFGEFQRTRDGLHGLSRTRSLVSSSPDTSLTPLPNTKRPNSQSYTCELRRCWRAKASEKRSKTVSSTKLPPTVTDGASCATRREGVFVLFVRRDAKIVSTRDETPRGV